MIAKVPPKRRDGKSDFKTLQQYLVRMLTDPATGEITREKVPTYTNCLTIETAWAEMQAAAFENPRVDDPIYHLILSWRSGETPNDKQMLQSGLHVMDSLGMTDHQYVFAVHRDTANVHMHLMLNRVHPDTGKVVYPFRDYFTLDKAMRELELAQGWEHDEGPYQVIDGKVMRKTKATKLQEKQPTKSRDMERHTGNESLFTYARGEPRKQVMALLAGAGPSPTWQTLHATLGKFGLAIRPKGKGLGIYVLDDESITPIKASDMHENLSLARLEKRLGAYVHTSALVLDPPLKYNKHRTVLRDPAERESARDKRAAQRKKLKADYQGYKAEFKPADDLTSLKLKLAAQYGEIREVAAKRRAEIRAGNNSASVKKALLSGIAMEAVQKREEARVSIAEERKLLKSRPGNKAQDFEQWVQERAQEGNEAAISQLRGWAYADKRKAIELANAEASREGADAITADVIGRWSPAAPKRFTKDVRWNVDVRTGDVHYRRSDRDIFVDSGRRITYTSVGLMDDASIVAGLMLGREKFGKVLKIEGSEAFKRRVIELDLQHRLGLQFTTPDMKELRRGIDEELTRPVLPGAQAIEELANSVRKAQEWIKSTGKGEVAVDLEKGCYVGSVLYKTEHHFVQDIGRLVAVHELKRLAGQVQVGQSVRIQYPSGGVEMTKEKTRVQTHSR